MILSGVEFEINMLMLYQKHFILNIQLLVAESQNASQKLIFSQVNVFKFAHLMH